MRGSPATGTLRCSHSGTSVLGDALQLRGHAGLAEILLRQNVHRDLRPRLRHLNVFHLEHHRTVGIDDPRSPRHKGKRSERVGPRRGVATRDLHETMPFECWPAAQPSCRGVAASMMKIRLVTLPYWPHRSVRHAAYVKVSRGTSVQNTAQMAGDLHLSNPCFQQHRCHASQAPSTNGVVVVPVKRDSMSADVHLRQGKNGR